MSLIKYQKIYAYTALHVYTRSLLTDFVTRQYSKPYIEVEGLSHARGRCAPRHRQPQRPGAYQINNITSLSSAN